MQREDADHGADLDRRRRAVGAVEDVVEEAVLLVPQALGVHGVDDQHEVLDELHLDVGPGVVLGRQDPRHLQQREGVERHPAGAVGLLEAATRREVRAVDRADVVQAEEAAGEQVVALGVHPVDPPGEVHQQLRQQPGEEVGVATPVDVPHVQRRPGMHGRVGVAERPLVGRQRAVGVLEPLPAHGEQLVLGEGRVEVRQGDRVEGEVPGREPGVLPRVGHREDVLGVDVEPAGVATVAAFGRGRRLGGVAVEPALHVVAVELLAPDHPGEGLPGDQTRVVVDGGGDDLAVELVGLLAALVEHLVERACRTRATTKAAAGGPGPPGSLPARP